MLPHFHEDAFEAHERRGQPRLPAHETQAPSHQRLHRAAPAVWRPDAAPPPPAVRLPLVQRRHTLPAPGIVPLPPRRERLAEGALAAAAQAEAALSAAAAGQRASQQAAEAQTRAAEQRAEQGHHSRAAIHARHQARVAYDHALAQYHLELRAWRQLLTVREQLIKKLISLEKRIAAQQARQARLTQPARPHVL